MIVDDIDRCLPPTVIDILEAIKLFLSVEKMAFVLAADEAPVSHAIATVFGSERDGDLAGKYLEKIVQLPVRVPALARADVESYVAQLLLWHRYIEDPDRFETIRQRCLEARATGAARHLADVEVGLPGSDDVVLAERLAPILYEELQGNPRRIKRVLNALWIRSSIAARRGLELDLAAFAKLVLLEEVFPSDFRTLLTWLSTGVLPDKIRELEGGEGDYPLNLRRWARLEPSFASVDIAGYLVLAAALQGEVVAVDSLPAHLREVADQLTSQSDGDRAKARKDFGGDDHGIEDRCVLARHLGEAIRLQPSRQHDLAESLAAVVAASNEVAIASLTTLHRMQASEVAPALVITLLPPGQPPLPAFLDLVTGWIQSGGLNEETARAVNLALDPTP